MFTLGFVQFCPTRHDVNQNVATLERLLSGVRADLLVLPELANSGYMFAEPGELIPYSEPGDGSGPFLSVLRELAQQIGGVIVAGFAERTPYGLFNSAAAVGEGGVLSLYRKTHLFADEKNLFLPGDTGFQVFEHGGARIGLMVCFDWFFPESARTLTLLGAQIIAHPANLVLPYCQQAMVTRSLENGVFSVTANRYGQERLGDKTLLFTGASQVMDTKGRRLAQAPEQGDHVALCEIDPTLADNKWLTGTNHLLHDRRVALYHMT